MTDYRPLIQPGKFTTSFSIELLFPNDYFETSLSLNFKSFNLHPCSWQMTLSYALLRKQKISKRNCLNFGHINIYKLKLHLHLFSLLLLVFQCGSFFLPETTNPYICVPALPSQKAFYKSSIPLSFYSVFNLLFTGSFSSIINMI